MKSSRITAPKSVKALIRGIRAPLAAAGLLLLAGLGAAGTSNASMIFETASGASTSGGPVSAEATFTFGTNSLQITLSDLLANPGNVGQLLSGLSFTIDGFTSGTLTSSSGQSVSVAKTTGVPTLGTTGSTGWILQSGFDLCDICATSQGANAPADLIIGPPAADGNYDAAGGSIDGNSPHNPFINQTATFTIDIAGLTADDSISSVLFRFGTKFGTQTSGGICTSGCTTTSVPEPATLALFAAGLAGLGFALSRRRKNV